jgi:hypothetical protein
LKNLCFHERDFGLKAEWHFFGTAHGKGTCDGVGGTTKRVIGRLALQRPQDNQILTAADMYKVAIENIKNIRYIIFFDLPTSLKYWFFLGIFCFTEFYNF